MAQNRFTGALMQTMNVICDMFISKITTTLHCLA